MRSRKSLNRRTFRPESLESRLSPSHFSGLAQVVTMHASAHVRHFSDTSSRDRVNSVDQNHGVENSPDTIRETGSIDRNSKDLSPNDTNSVDSNTSNSSSVDTHSKDTHSKDSSSTDS